MQLMVLKELLNFIEKSDALLAMHKDAQNAEIEDMYFDHDLWFTALHLLQKTPYNFIILKRVITKCSLQNMLILQ